MGILDGVVGAAGAIITRAATDYIKVAGLDLSGGRSGDWRAKMNRPGQQSYTREAANSFTTQNITYPINVEGDPQQGHFIMFMINVQDDAILKAQKEQRRLQNVIKELDPYGGFGPENAESGPSPMTQLDELTRKIKNPIGTHQVEGLDLRGGSAWGGHQDHWNPSSDKIAQLGSIQLQYQATRRLKTAISLYMPPSISVSYGMQYANADIGMLAEGVAGAIKAFMRTEGNTTTKLTAGARSILKGAGPGIEKFIQSSLDVVAPGAKALMQMEAGRIIAPRMEIMFEGVGRREFTYTFIFIPKSVEESRIVEEIIHQFKYHMHPEFEDDNARLMKFPSTFDIMYMYQYGPNNFLNKISTCFLTKMDVEYGADRFTAYERTDSKRGTGAPPQKTKLSLSFSEMEILTKARIDQGW